MIRVSHFLSSSLGTFPTMTPLIIVRTSPFSSTFPTLMQRTFHTEIPTMIVENVRTKVVSPGFYVKRIILYSFGFILIGIIIFHAQKPSPSSSFSSDSWHPSFEVSRNFFSYISVDIASQPTSSSRSPHCYN